MKIKFKNKTKNDFCGSQSPKRAKNQKFKLGIGQKEYDKVLVQIDTFCFFISARPIWREKIGGKDVEVKN